MFWFRMNNICDNPQASKNERFYETRREINKDSATSKKNLHRFPLLIVRCSSNCFSALQALIPLSPPCLFCVSGTHRECNHGSARSTRPITVPERTAICKSQLEPIIENPGNTRGAGGGGGASFWSLIRRWTIYTGILVRLQRRLHCLQTIHFPSWVAHR